MPRITEERIQEMLELTPRRMKISVEFSDRYGVREPYPKGSGKDWSVRFPFPETFWESFNHRCEDDHTGKSVDPNGRCYTYLKHTAFADKPPESAAEACEIIGGYVAIRDCLDLSFALDYDHAEGNPGNPHSEVGRLRDLAKPRDGSQPTAGNFRAGGQGLLQRCLDFLEEMTCYEDVDCVVAMPSSRPDKKFNLPRSLAKAIAEELELADLSDCVRTVRERNQLKGVCAEDRLETIRGTIEVDEDAFEGRTVLLLDDVYQSGVSMNYVAMLLQEAGAERIYGLACDKTCSNTDNIG